MSKSRAGLEQSPYYESLKEINVPVLVIGNELDELTLTEAGQYKNVSFENIE